MIVIYHRGHVVNPTPPYLLLRGGWISRKCLHTSNLCNLLSLKAAYLCVHVSCTCSQNKAAIVLRQPLLPTVPNPPLYPILIPSPLALLPQSGIQPREGSYLRQPGSLTALPRAPPSPPFQRSSESCRFSASSFPLSRGASPYATRQDHLWAFISGCTLPRC
ncbi:unnamed protein product [Boreogadus saida]